MREENCGLFGLAVIMRLKWDCALMRFTWEVGDWELPKYTEHNPPHPLPRLLYILAQPDKSQLHTSPHNCIYLFIKIWNIWSFFFSPAPCLLVPPIYWKQMFAYLSVFETHLCKLYCEPTNQSKKMSSSTKGIKSNQKQSNSKNRLWPPIPLPLRHCVPDWPVQFWADAV